MAPPSQSQSCSRGPSADLLPVGSRHVLACGTTRTPDRRSARGRPPRRERRGPHRDRLDAIVRTDARQARQHPRRSRILSGVVICTVICAVVNAAVGVVGVLTQVDALAVICLTMTPLIYAVALLLLLFPAATGYARSAPPALRSPPPHRPFRRPPCGVLIALTAVPDPTAGESPLRECTAVRPRRPRWSRSVGVGTPPLTALYRDISSRCRDCLLGGWRSRHTHAAATAADIPVRPVGCAAEHASLGRPSAVRAQPRLWRESARTGNPTRVLDGGEALARAAGPSALYWGCAAPLRSRWVAWRVACSARPATSVTTSTDEGRDHAAVG